MLIPVFSDFSSHEGGDMIAHAYDLVFGIFIVSLAILPTGLAILGFIVPLRRAF